MSRILVTGALGTLGRPLVQHLRTQGHTVFTTDISHHSDPSHTRADIRNFRELERLFIRIAPVDTVFHLAAEFGRINGEEYYETLYSTNITGTRHILELQRRFEFFHVFASSSEVYGNINFSPLSENMVKSNNPTYPNDYALTKRVNELQVQRFARQHNTRSVILRFFNAYGPGEYYTPYRSVVALFTHRLLHSLPITVYKDYHRVFMYIDDFIPTLARCADPSRQSSLVDKVINIGGTEYRSVEELAQLVLTHTNANPNLIRPSDKDLHNITNKKPDVTLAMELLGHDPSIPLEVGVKHTVDWHRSLIPQEQPNVAI